MNVTTSRSFRQKHIKTYQIADFDSFDDYFLYIHLNPAVRWAHAWGAVLGVILLIWGLYMLLAERSWIALIVGVGLYYGVGFVSHYVFDGVFFETGKYQQGSAASPQQTYLQSYRSLIQLILATLSGKDQALEKAFWARYPHTRWIFDATSTESEQAPSSADQLLLSHQSAAKENRP
ncbi:MAG: hypothetical protein CVV27_12855 [Candidatus Melainabacteria bacterium HGW-Melainabacteria-1]|nr:MAG: hypothetical protein CVV27_12855 [Candidatus Melainabacteria bacterium HGW-Melainabacteria-1]